MQEVMGNIAHIFQTNMVNSLSALYIKGSKIYYENFYDLFIIKLFIPYQKFFVVLQTISLRLLYDIMIKFKSTFVVNQLFREQDIYYLVGMK